MFNLLTGQPIQQTKLSFHSSLPNGKNEESWLLTGIGPQGNE